MSRIIHFIPTLETGGAERLLEYIVNKDKENKHLVICFLSKNECQNNSNKYEVISVDISNFIKFIPALYKINRTIDLYKPDVLHCWMYHSNALSIFFFKRMKNVIWSIHNSSPNYFFKIKYPKLLLSILTCKLFINRVPKYTIFPSENSINEHREFGFNTRNSVFIPNAVDTDKFKFSEKNSDGIVTIGFVGRFHDQKGIPTLLKALYEVTRNNKNINVLLCGTGFNDQNDELKDLFDKYYIKNLVMFDDQKDMVKIYKQIDLLVLPSHYGETFPLILLEGGVSGCFLLATKVGDSDKIIKDERFIVEPLNVKSLIAAIDLYLTFSEDEKKKIIMNNYKNISQNYNLDTYIRSTNRLYMSLS